MSAGKRAEVSCTIRDIAQRIPIDRKDAPGVATRLVYDPRMHPVWKWLKQRAQGNPPTGASLSRDLPISRNDTYPVTGDYQDALSLLLPTGGSRHAICCPTKRARRSALALSLLLA